MKIMILIVVAYNPGYINVLLDHLHWAFQKFDFEINILTFTEYKKYFENKRANFHFYDKPVYSSKESWWFPFHNYSHLYIKNLNFDYCIFLEQDVIFTKIVEESYFHQDKLSLFITEKYLSVLDSDMQVLYPRIWEGCLFAPRKILLRAIDDNVNFGNNKLGAVSKNVPQKNIFFPNLYTKHSGKFISIDEFLKSNKSDTMFEFSMWCFANNIGVENYSIDENCEEGEIVIHFRGFEIIPWIIDKGDKINLFDKNNYKNLNYLYLSCLYEDFYLQKQIYNFNKNLRIKIMNKIERINTDWMSTSTLINHNKFINYLLKIKLI